MLLSHFYPTILTLSVILSQANAQFPQCIRNCIDSSEDSNCQASDLACLCRAGRSSGAFLPSLVTCMHNDCIDISVDILLSPLKITCILAGAPLPDSAVQAAESAAESLATATTTATETATEITTATRDFTSVVQTTVTVTEEGMTNTVVFPVTIERTKTVSGAGSTVTQTASSSSSSSSESDASGSTSGSSSISEDSTTTFLISTTVLGEALTSILSNTDSGASSTSTSTSTSGPRPATETDSTPFVDTSAAGTGVEVGSWLGLGVCIVMAAVWF